MSCCKTEVSDKIVVSINGEKLRQGDLYESTLLAFALNPKEFESKLLKLGLKFDSNPYKDIEFLAELSRIGGDRNGTMKDKGGNPIIFDLNEFIRTIPVDNSVNNPIKTEIK